MGVWAEIIGVIHELRGPGSNMIGVTFSKKKENEQKLKFYIQRILPGLWHTVVSHPSALRN